MATRHRHYYGEPAHQHGRNQSGENSWHHPVAGGRMIDFYDAIGLADWPNVAVTCESGKHPVHQPGRRAAVKAVYERRVIAIPPVVYAGETLPAVRGRFGVYYVAISLALNWPALLAVLPRSMYIPAAT